MDERCFERERLLFLWAECSDRVTKLLREELAAMKSLDHGLASFEDQVRLARAAETEACRKYFSHVNLHGCV
jgi:hypothetical protein